MKKFDPKSEWIIRWMLLGVSAFAIVTALALFSGSILSPQESFATEPIPPPTPTPTPTPPPTEPPPIEGESQQETLQRLTEEIEGLAKEQENQKALKASLLVAIK